MPARRTPSSLVVLLTVLALAGAPGVAGAAVTVVHPNALAGWEIFSENLDGDADAPSGTFVNGPASPPAGVGSFRQQAETGDKQTLRTTNANGTSLSGIQIEYSTYTTDTPPTVLTAAVNISSDTNGDGLSDETLVFEPYEQATNPDPSCALTQNTSSATWQTWDADAGCWWSTAIGVGGDRFTLAEYLTMPGKAGAQLALVSQGAFRLVVGSTGSSWPNFDGNVDEVTINGDTWDFETFVEDIDCDALADDLSAIQLAVDGVPNGSTIRLKGACDLSAAAAHGGDLTSVANAAILIRAAGPIDGLTIESDGAPQSGSLIGSGTQAAFVIGPGNENVTIRGLRFANVGRAVVAINTEDTTVGSLGPGMFPPNPVPAALGNRIIGGPSMDSAILGLAVDRGPSIVSVPGTITINYGAGGANMKVFTGQASGTLTDFDVLGNYISYDPPGADNGTTQIVAIDVRQRYERVVSDVLVKHNAVGMFSSEFPSINMNCVKFHSLTPKTPSSPPVVTDYFIRDVEVDGNNCGRLEELGDPIADVHASGRLGIGLTGVSDFTITDNGVRARLSPTGIPMPGGGIVTSDSGFGRIANNGVIVVADPSTLDSDMGAIGVVDEINLAFGGNPKGQPSTEIEIEGNTIGPVTSDPPGVWAQRGIVVTGSSEIVAHDNNVKATSDAAVNIGVEVVGPGSITSPGPITLPQAVTDSVVCGNTLDGSADDPAEVAFGVGSSNAFPGGGAFAGNAGCVPSLALSPAIVNASTSLSATGTGWPGRPVRIRLSDTAGPATVVTKTGTASSAGSYAISFTPAELGPLVDGTVTGVARSSDPDTAIFQDSATTSFLKDFDLPASPVITLPAEGVTTGSLVQIQGTAQPGVTVTVREGASPLGSTTAGGSGAWSLARTFGDGPHVIDSIATDGAGNDSFPSALRSFIVDATAPLPPVILTPTEGEVVTTNTVVISGTAEADSEVEVRDSTNAVLGTDVADGPGGAWSITKVLADRAYSIVATATDDVGNDSDSAVRGFIVKTDFSAPVAPVIAAPGTGSLQPPAVTVYGTAEGGTTVRIYEGAVQIGSVIASAGASFSAGITFGGGAHAIRATSTDAGGNTSPSSPVVSFSVDATPPSVAVTTPSGQLFLATPVHLEGTAGDNAGVVSVELTHFDASGRPVRSQVVGVTPAGGTSVGWEADPAGLLPGPHSTQVVSIDVVGNRSAAVGVSFTKVP